MSSDLLLRDQLASCCGMVFMTVTNSHVTGQLSRALQSNASLAEGTICKPRC